MKTNHPILSIRRAGVPLTCFETSDPAHTVAGITNALNGKSEDTPLVEWDAVRGVRTLNHAGKGSPRRKSNQMSEGQ